MKTQDTIAGNYYGITSPNGCTVTDELGKLKKTVEAGDQLTVQAPGAKLIVDDDEAVIIKAPFKRAALALGLLGGGVKSDLPAGYLRAEFLESTGAQYINPSIYTRELYNGAMMTMRVNAGSVAYVGAYRNDGFSCQFYISTGDTPGTAFFSPPLKGDPVSGKVIYKVKDSDFFVNGAFLGKLEKKEEAQVLSRADNFMLFARSEENNGVKCYSCAIYSFDALNAKLLPCINESGAPRMYDTKRKKAYSNAGTGQFIAGFTLAQARKLGKHLPAGGGKLTISLPTGYEQDAAVSESLETARAKGWTLTIQTYTPEAEAAAATFGMRRVWVRRIQDEHGGYVDADGVRWSVDWCVDMVTPDGSTPEQHGYELYRSTEAAVAYWELTPYVDPEAEQELLTTESL